jgi:hypothetical protein
VIGVNCLSSSSCSSPSKYCVVVASFGSPRTHAAENASTQASNVSSAAELWSIAAQAKLRIAKRIFSLQQVNNSRKQREFMGG